MKEIKIIATDLDGTLLNSRLELSQTNRHALKKLKKHGVQVVLCTGRPFNGMKHLIEEIGLDANDYTVSYNGSLVQSCDEKRILHQASLTNGDFLKLSNFFEGYGLGLHAMTKNEMYTYNHQLHSLTVRESYLGNLPISVLSKGEEPQSTIIKMMAVGNPDDLDTAIKDFSLVFGDTFSLNKSEAFYLEIMQKGDDKAKALSLLLDELNLTKENLLAFGNNLNDLEMLKFAKIGVAVGNAVPALKAESDYVTETNDKDGVAVFLKNYYSKPETLLA